MATYAIGDVQGCFEELQALLALIRYDPHVDHLWFSGDLVNRGPQSLACLRFIKSLPHTTIVLGNHDLHLIALANNIIDLKKKDTLAEILTAPDQEELIFWLRQQKLLHYDPQLNYVLVHAGLPPQWDLNLALACAQEVEQALQGKHYHHFLEHMYGDTPKKWKAELTGVKRLRFITNCLTRIRFCTTEGQIDLKSKEGLGSQRKNYYPWFSIPNRAHQDLNIIFGHWAALQGISYFHTIFPIDTGCVWGGFLTAMRLEDRVRFQVPYFTGR
ncbi:MAG: symmetrical bis(5'-nucleosyl)-tetraphosphatase [Legionellales bacterium]|nr:symmetrical bis(5'-nucleosyl)-tetraphosphatase [Legionellales bacterium]